MRTFIESLIRPRRVVHAHCDLPCGVYDPAQARIEAESVAAIQKQMQQAHDGQTDGLKGFRGDVDEFIARAAKIKEDRAELTKHHLWVLWTDYFKPDVVQKSGLDETQLHDLFWRATKEAGEAKKSSDAAQGQKLLDLIGEVDTAFQKSKQ